MEEQPYPGHVNYGVGVPPPHMMFPGQPGAQPNPFSWMQYQQMLQQGGHHYPMPPPTGLPLMNFNGGAGGKGSLEEAMRRRTNSGPQHAAHPGGYPAYPGAHPGFVPHHGGVASKASSLVPTPSPSHSSGSSSISSSGPGQPAPAGFHPYRRAARSSDATAPPPSQQPAASAAAAVNGNGIGARPPRARTTSNVLPPTGSEALLAGTNGGRRPVPPSLAAGGHHSPYHSTSSSSLRGGSSGTPLGHAYSMSMPATAVPTIAPLTLATDALSLGGGAQPSPPPPVLAHRSSDSASSNGKSPHHQIERRPPPSLSGGSNSHSRDDSLSSQGSRFSNSAGGPSSATTHDSMSSTGRTTPTPISASSMSKKPSPLSRDQPDNQSIATTISPPSIESSEKKKGLLSGKLRKALSFSTLDDITNTQHTTSQHPSASSRQHSPVPLTGPNGRQLPPRSTASASAKQGPQHQHHGLAQIHTSSQDDAASSMRSISPPPSLLPPRSASALGMDSGAASISSKRTRPPVAGEGRRSLFNRKFNSSTDNISLSSKLSISSTVSSASMMLRKVGGLGKLAKKSTLMGISNIFQKDRDEEDKFGPIGGDAKAAKKSKSKKTGSAEATSAISHATAEQDGYYSQQHSRTDSGMTPAAHYVRQMQEAEARAEAAAAAARREAEAASAKKAAAAAKAAEEAQGARQKMLEKEKASLKSKRAGGWRKRIGMGSSSDAPKLTGLETTPLSDEHRQEAEAAASGYPQYAKTAVGPVPPGAFSREEEGAFDDAFDAEELEPPHMPGSLYGSAADSGDEFETDSLRHWGEGIELARASASKVQAPRSILKKSASEQVLAEGDRPWTRVRANSYDVPNGPSTAGAPLMSQMSNTTAGVDRMDGVAPRPASPQFPKSASGGPYSQQQHPAPAPSPSPTPSPLGHHSNSSMPTLSLFGQGGDPDLTLTLGSAQRGHGRNRKRLIFAEEDIFHSTWPAHVYDRRGDLATCNRLTPLLAQQIKEVSSKRLMIFPSPF